MDKRDEAKPSVRPLVDNKHEDCYLYEITVITGNRRHAGTNSNVFITLYGDLNDSGVRQLSDEKRVCFLRSSVDVFIMTTSGCLGDLSYIRLWHDNTGGGWYLRNVVIADMQSKKQFQFIANRWVAVDKDDFSLDLAIPVSGSDDLSNFNYLFTTKVRHGLTEDHIWFSIFTRSHLSSFTRCQRFSVAICLAMTSMTASAMFFGKVPPGNPTTENKIAMFSFTWMQIYVGVVCALITFPVNLLLIQLFRLVADIRNKEEKKRIRLFIPNADSTQQQNFTDIKEEANTIFTIKENPRCLNISRLLLSIVWFICVATIICCSFVISLYGISFGNKKSLDWLASITISMVQDVFLHQPIKIFFMAFCSAFAIKKIGKKDNQTKLVDDERIMISSVYAKLSSKVLTPDDKLFCNTNEPVASDKTVSVLKPPDATLLKKMRDTKLEELRIQATIRDFFFYCCFTLMVFCLAFLSQDNSKYFQTLDIEGLFNPRFRSDGGSNIQLLSQKDFWLWFDDKFLPQVYPNLWFKNENRAFEKDFPGQLFLNDFNSMIVTGIRIRQVRVKTYSCSKAASVAKLSVLDCISAYKPSVEETRDFALNWTIPKTFNSEINFFSKPWRYQSSKELDGYPFSAKLETYLGGGYVVEIFPKFKNQKVIDQLKHQKWIDRQTRAVIIEFALFNGATNYFNMVTIVFEFPPSGGMIPYFDVATFDLYTSTSNNKIANIVLQILFILMMFLFTVRECRVLYKRGCNYFREFWNLVECALILFSLLEVAFYFYKAKLVDDLLRRVPDKEPQKFINFQFAAYWSLIYTHIIALVTFFVTVKFIKLLRFNSHISMLSIALKISWHPLCMLGIIFILIMLPIVICSNMIFGELLDGYQSLFKSAASAISLLLGKFSFYQFENANGVLGPIFFFGFTIFMNWIIMNMFISILNDAFKVVRLNNALQEDQLKIFDSFANFLKDWFKCECKKEVARKLTSPILTLNAASSSFSYVNAPFIASPLNKTLKEPLNKEIAERFSKNESLLEEVDESTLNEALFKFFCCIDVLHSHDSNISKDVDEYQVEKLLNGCL